MAARARCRAAIVVVSVLLAGESGIAQASGWTVDAAGSIKSEARSASLSPPTNVSVTCTSPTSVTVSWTATAGGGFVVVSDSTSATTGYKTAGYTQASSLLVALAPPSGRSSTATYWFEVSTAYTSSWVGANSSPIGPVTLTSTSCS